MLLFVLVLFVLVLLLLLCLAAAVVVFFVALVNGGSTSTQNTKIKEPRAHHSLATLAVFVFFFVTPRGVLFPKAPGCFFFKVFFKSFRWRRKGGAVMC